MNTKPQRPVFELNRLTEYTDEAILSELRRLAALVPDGAITGTHLKLYGRVSLRTIRNRFGSLHNALDAIGLRHRSTDDLGTSAARPSRRMSDEQMLQSLGRLAIQLGKTELSTADIDEHLPFSDKVIRKRWGSLKSALELVGLTTVTRSGRRYTDEECFSNMLEVWAYHGRPPTREEMSKPPSKVGSGAYKSRFRTWN